MVKHKSAKLSRRERQIMDVVYRIGEGTVSEVLSGLSDPPSYSAIRATMGVLEDKGLLRHRRDGRRFVYSPTLSRRKARRSALEHVLTTFFDGSAEGAVAALLELQSANLTEEELNRIHEMIEQAKKEGR